jgi:hypothetical protein
VFKPCRSWLVADVSEVHTAFIIRAEVRKVKKQLVYNNWPFRIRDEARRGTSVSRQMEKTQLWS